MTTSTTPPSAPRKRPPVAAIVGGVVALGVVVVAVATIRPPTASSPTEADKPVATAPVSVDPAVPAEHLHDENDGQDHTGHDHGPTEKPGGGAPAVPAPAAKPPTPASAPPITLPPSQRGGRPSGTVQAPKPTPAAEDLPPDHPPVTADNAAQVSVQWLGYSCFYIHTPGGSAVVTDPYDPKATGLPPPSTGAHLITISSETPAHNNIDGVHAFLDENSGQRLAKEVLRGQAGNRADLQVTPIPTGSGNSAYLIQAGPFRIVHLGTLDHALTAAQAKALGRVDLLMLPVGERLAPKEAVVTAQRINPRVILPMAYREGEGSGSAARLRPLEEFISASPFAVTPRDADIMLISQDDLPASTEVWTLKPPQR